MLINLILKTFATLLRYKNTSKYIEILSGLYSISKSLINSTGVIPVFIVLNKTFKLIQDDEYPANYPSSIILKFDAIKYNPYVVKLITEFLCSVHPRVFIDTPYQFLILYKYMLYMLIFRITVKYIFTTIKVLFIILLLLLL